MKLLDIVEEKLEIKGKSPCAQKPYWRKTTLTSSGLTQFDEL